VPLPFWSARADSPPPNICRGLAAARRDWFQSARADSPPPNVVVLPRLEPDPRRFSPLSRIHRLPTNGVGDYAELGERVSVRSRGFTASQLDIPDPVTARGIAFQSALADSPPPNLIERGWDPIQIKFQSARADSPPPNSYLPSS